MKVLLQTHAQGHPDLNREGVPKATDFATTDEQKQMLELFFSQEVFGRPYVVAPEVPRERALLLRKAFWETLHDPDLIADATKAILEVDPVSGEDVEKLIAKVYAAPKPLVEKIKRALETAY